MISVVIPNYNHKKYLTQRIESVINQTYDQIEVFILDDCSTDGSRDIIENYRHHPKVKHIIYNETNSGSPFLQWRKGIDLAVGEWIWIAESDDYADHEFLSTMINSLPESQNCGLLYCDSYIVTNDIVSRETFASKRKRQLGITHWDKNYICNGILEIEDYLMPHGTVNNTSAVLFNASVIKSVNPFDISLRFMGDKYAFLRVLAVSDIAYINKPLNYYRSAADNKPKHTNDYFDYFYEHFLIFNWINKNLRIVERAKFTMALELNCQVSLINLNSKRLDVFVSLIRTNPSLFFEVVKINFIRSIKSYFQRLKTAI